MSNLPTPYLSDEQITTLAQAGVIPYGVPAPVLTVFAHAAREHGLSPFKKEIYLVKYGGTYNTIVGIDGMRAKAARTKQFAGREDARFNLQPDGQYLTASQLAKANTMPTTCTVTVHRMIDGQRCPFTKTVVFAEYCPANRSGKWATMPYNMIEKCAEAAALRMAFSDQVAGLHIEEEQAAFEDVQISAANDPAVLKMKERAEYLLERCNTLTDEQESAARAELARPDLNRDRIGAIIKRLEDLMPPSADPKEQFKQIAKNL